MSVKLLGASKFIWSRPNLRLSKCQIVGNVMPRLINMPAKLPRLLKQNRP